ncbi:acyl-CoA dehydrogenase family protein [Cumulibacter soli]|uniref:acyl-CoA dehydrogenase family protein n=1 Tax=Cumulibacter soli TaxID=2546344 RepID=UPI001068A5EA|nr:acyl-CoA dehydrogenase family protein [Cumulibacter soli]
MSEESTRAELAEFADAVRGFCQDKLPEHTVARPGVVRDADAARSNWRALAVDLGVASLLIPEEHGGSGASLIEVGRVAEALGAELATVPFLSSGVLAPALLAPIATNPVAADLLARIASGTIVTVAWAGEDPGVATAAKLITDDGGASGTFRYAIDADIAEVVILVGAGGAEIAAVNASDLRITARPTFDLTRGLADIAADKAPASLLASGDEAIEAFRDALVAARLALASESAAGAGAALQVAVQYARERVQFGREIGSFQAIKHMLADCFVNEQSALSVARQAIEALVAAEDEADELVAAAAFYCADRYVDVAATGIQVHGGIGFTVERAAHLYRRRAEANRHLLGTPEQLKSDYLTLLKSKENAA